MLGVQWGTATNMVKIFVGQMSVDPPPSDLQVCTGLNSYQFQVVTGLAKMAPTGVCATVQHVCRVNNQRHEQGCCGYLGTPSEYGLPGENPCQAFGSCAAPINKGRVSSEGANKGKNVSKLARQRFEQRMYDVGKPFGPAPSAGIPDGAVRLVRKRDLRRRRSFELRRQRAVHSAGRGFRPQRIRKLMARSSVPGAGAPRLGLPDLGLGVGLCSVPKFGLLYDIIDVDPGNLAGACAPIVEPPATEPPVVDPPVVDPPACSRTPELSTDCATRTCGPQRPHNTPVDPGPSPGSAGVRNRMPDPSHLEYVAGGGPHHCRGGGIP